MRLYFSHWKREDKTVVDYYSLDTVNDSKRIKAKLKLADSKNCSMVMYDRQPVKADGHIIMNEILPANKKKQKEVLEKAIELILTHVEECVDTSASTNVNEKDLWKT